MFGADGFTQPVKTAPCCRTRRWRIAESCQRLQQIANALAGGRRQTGATLHVQAACHRSEQLQRLRHSEQCGRLPVPYTCAQNVTATRSADVLSGPPGRRNVCRVQHTC